MRSTSENVRATQVVISRIYHSKGNKSNKWRNRNWFKIECQSCKRELYTRNYPS